MASSSELFLKTLSDSTLLTADKFEEVAKYAEDEPDAQRLAKQLVKRQLVTRWQAKKLLAGRQQFQIGNYKLLDLLGRGAMGTVYRAEHVGLRRDVAIKVMSRRYLNNSLAVSRFLSEIRMVSELNHPNVVRAFDADYEQGRYFLVMEYVAGKSVEEWLAKPGRFLLGWTCECIRQAALGLQHAAERNLIHRDVKPSNMIVPNQRAENQPLVKLLDFGLAFSLGEVEEQGFTQPGRTVGTVDYMSPEQSLTSRDIDARTDIYSLGCVFFQLLTGRLPFEGATAIDRLSLRMKYSPPPPSRFRADVPPELDAIVAKMLDRKREGRYCRPIELAEALKGYAYAAPDTAPKGMPPKPRKRERSRPR